LGLIRRAAWISGRGESIQLWYVLWAINELRNRIAHKLDSDAIEGKMK
jgi:hypothetical protein